MHRARSRLVLTLALAVGLPAAATAQVSFTERGGTVLNGIDLRSRSASLADYDRDGDLDVLFQGQTGARQLLRNNFVENGELTFTSVTSASNINSGVGDSWSAAWGDYDGDGYVDVFIGQTNSGGSGDVLRNNGGVDFTNTSLLVGLNDPGFHQNVAWIDIDNDRDLDLIIGMEGPEKHQIYLQGADGSFTQAGAAAGFQEAYGTKSYGMAMGDTDGDGDIDIYISTCISGGNIRNNFYENQLAQTGTLSFIDIADSNGTQNLDNSYHSEFVDFDNDGLLDLLMVGADQTPTRIFRNIGGNQFTDVADILGHDLISDTGGDLNGGRAIDYDNDGDLDLYMHDNLTINGANPSDQGRKLYRNDGNWVFTDVTTASGLATTNQGAYDSTWGDLDLDGDQDLIAPTRYGIDENVFLSNASENGNHWLYLRLDGTRDNTTAIGATVYATITLGNSEVLTLRREANTNAGTFNQSDVPVHFGLGDAEQIDELRIVWPDGTTQILHGVAVDQVDMRVAFPGDFNGDRVVDGDDLAEWQADFGYTAGSDVDRDGDSDGADFLAWQRTVGAGATAATIAGEPVPEPTSAALLLATVAALMVRARRTR